MSGGKGKMSGTGWHYTERYQLKKSQEAYVKSGEDGGMLKLRKKPDRFKLIDYLDKTGNIRLLKLKRYMSIPGNVNKIESKETMLAILKEQRKVFMNDSIFYSTQIELLNDIEKLLLS